MNDYPFSKIVIETSEPIESMATKLSELLFDGRQFCYDETGFFEEVPAMRLQSDFLGLVVAVHGGDGLYELLIQPHPNHLRKTQSWTMANISLYVACILEDTADWKVEVAKG
jgi:hypothetical protein